VIAVVDEAMIVRGTGSYILAAVIVPDARRASTRSRAISLLPRRRRRFHFRSEAEPERVAMLRLIAAEASAAVALVATPQPSAATEQARQQLLRELAVSLAARHRPLELALESREPHNDHRDRHTLATARQRGEIPGDLAYSHSLPSGEPLLWLADGLAGAVRASLLGDRHYVELLTPGQLRLEQKTL
jgi:hypothetical protein